MRNKKLILLLLLSIITLVNINVHADIICGSGDSEYKWVAGGWSAISPGPSTAVGQPTCSTTGTTHTQVASYNSGNSTCGYYIGPGCHQTQTWTRYSKIDCCCSGTTSKAYSCDTCGTGACSKYQLSFSNPIKHLSNGYSHTYEITLPEDAENSKWTLTATSNSEYVKLSKHTITANFTSTQSSCPTVKLEATKDSDNKHEYAKAETSVVIYPSWNDEGEKIMSELADEQGCSKYNFPMESADAQGKNEYRIDCESEGNLCKCHVYKRGCGSAPPKPSPACYIDSDGFMRYGIFSYSRRACYNKTTKQYVVCSGKSGEEPVKKDQCTTVPTCGMNSPKQDPKATPCNGEGDHEGTYDKYCKLTKIFNSNNQSSEKYFYDIICKENIYLKFDGPVTDHSMEEQNNAFLYVGTGFKYMLKANSRLKCDGAFDKSLYSKYLNYIKEYSSQFKVILGDDGQEVIKAFVALVPQPYVEWDPKYIFDGKVVLTDLKAKADKEGTYEVELVRNAKTEDLDKNTVICGELPKGSVDSNSGNLDLNKSSFTYEKKQYFEKIVPKACLDKKNGKVVYGQSCSDEYFLGSQFFISPDLNYINDENYNYTVSVTNMGFTGNDDKSYASNETKCHLNILDNQYLYRHVDPSDAFLKKTDPGRVTGLNWLNNKHDFTKIIKKETWSKASLYHTIRLNQEINNQIKGLTSGLGGTKYYVESCKENKTIICQLVNAAKKGTRKK